MEGQTNVHEIRPLDRFVEVICYEFRIDRSKWKPGNNNRKKEEKYFQMIDDIVLNDLAQGQKREEAYKKQAQEVLAAAITFAKNSNCKQT